MVISTFAIRRPVVTIVVMFGLVALGMWALASLHTDEFPDVQPPVVGVTVGYPGATPEMVERELLDPIEERMSGVADVVRITSSALDSSAILVVQFTFGKNVREAMQQIRDEMGAIRRDLPPESEEPVLTRLDPADLPIVSLTLSSRARSVGELTPLATLAIARKIRAIPGVGAARVVGGVERELTVDLRPEALKSAGVGIAQVVHALEAQNLSGPVGRVNDRFEERTIRLRGRFDRADEFEQAIVAQAPGQIVRLGDVAEVRDGAEEARSAALLNE